MKALTLRHPWAFMVAHAGKRIENREWDDRLAELMGVHQLVGERIAIHGGTAPQRPRRPTPLHKLAESNLWRQHCEGLHHVREYILGGHLPDSAAQHLAGRPVTAESFILPGIVALATIQSSTRASRDDWAAHDPLQPGRFLHIHLADVITLPEPVQVPGAQGFWMVPPVIEAEVTRAAGISREQLREQWGHLAAQDWLA